MNKSSWVEWAPQRWQYHGKVTLEWPLILNTWDSAVPRTTVHRKLGCTSLFVVRSSRELNLFHVVKKTRVPGNFWERRIFARLDKKRPIVRARKRSAVCIWMLVTVKQRYQHNGRLCSVTDNRLSELWLLCNAIIFQSVPLRSVSFSLGIISICFVEVSGFFHDASSRCFILNRTPDSSQGRVINRKPFRGVLLTGACLSQAYPRQAATLFRGLSWSHACIKD